jgi:hypothetical protein
MFAKNYFNFLCHNRAKTMPSHHIQFHEYTQDSRNFVAQNKFVNFICFSVDENEIFAHDSRREKNIFKATAVVLVFSGNSPKIKMFCLKRLMDGRIDRKLSTVFILLIVEENNFNRSNDP